MFLCIRRNIIKKIVITVLLNYVLVRIKLINVWNFRLFDQLTLGN